MHPPAHIRNHHQPTPHPESIHLLFPTRTLSHLHHLNPLRHRQSRRKRRIRLDLLHRRLIRQAPDLPVLQLPVERQLLNHHVLRAILLLLLARFLLLLAIRHRLGDGLLAPDPHDGLSDPEAFAAREDCRAVRHDACAQEVRGEGEGDVLVQRPVELFRVVGTARDAADEVFVEAGAADFLEGIGVTSV